MIFIKPTVLRTSADGRDLTSERYEYLMGEQIRQTPPNRIFWGDPTQPMLPPQGVSPGTPGLEPTPPLLRDGMPPPAPTTPPAGVTAPPAQAPAPSSSPAPRP
jgi:general secretion pathway protein D